MSLSLCREESASSSSRPAMTRASTLYDTGSVVTPLDDPSNLPVRTGSLFRKRFEAALAKQRAQPKEPSTLEIPTSPALVDVVLDVDGLRSTGHASGDKRESYFDPVPPAPARTISVAGSSISNCSPSTRELITRYEAMSPISISNASSIIGDSHSSRSRRPLPEVPSRPQLSKSRRPSYLRDSFKNLLTVFKVKIRNSDSGSQRSSMLSPRPDSLRGMEGPRYVPSVKSTELLTTPVRTEHTGQVLYLFRPQFEGMLPVWTNCIATLSGSSVVLNWKSAYGNPAMHTITLAAATDVRSVPFSEVNITEKKLLPDTGEEAHVFEIQFANGMHERFATSTVVSRSGWVSAVWQALVDNGRAGLGTDAKEDPDELHENSILENSPISIPPSTNTVRHSPLDEARKASAEGQFGQISTEATSSVGPSEVPSVISVARDCQSRMESSKADTQWSPLNISEGSQSLWAEQQSSHTSWTRPPPLAPSNLTKILQASTSSVQLPSHFIDRRTVNTGTASFSYGADNTFGDDGSCIELPSPGCSSRERAVSVAMSPLANEAIDAQTIFSSRYSQASQEDLCIPALSVHTAQLSHVTSHEASHMPFVNPGNASTAATRGEHPVCPQAYALPSIHSFHTQLEVASEWHGTRRDDTHSMANASVYESCISASHAHSTCATTTQTYAASSTLAETTQGKQDNTGEAAVPPSSSMKRILSDLKSGTVRSVKSSKSIQYLGSIAAVKKRLSLFTQKSREDSSQQFQPATQFPPEKEEAARNTAQQSTTPSGFASARAITDHRSVETAVKITEVPSLDTMVVTATSAQGTATGLIGPQRVSRAWHSAIEAAKPLSPPREEVMSSAVRPEQIVVPDLREASQSIPVHSMKRCTIQTIPQQFATQTVHPPDAEDSEAIFDLYNYRNAPLDAPVRRFLSPVPDVSEPECTLTVKSQSTITEPKATVDNQNNPQPEDYLSNDPSQPVLQPRTQINWDPEKFFGQFEELLKEDSIQHAAYSTSIYSKVELVQTQLLAIHERTMELPSAENLQTMMEPLLSEVQKMVENNEILSQAKLNELGEALAFIKQGIAQLQVAQEANLTELKDEPRQKPVCETLPDLPPIPQEDILREVQDRLEEIKGCITAAEPIREVIQKLDSLSSEHATREDIGELKEKLDQLLEKATLMVERIGEKFPSDKTQALIAESVDAKVIELCNESKQNSNDKSEDPKQCVIAEQANPGVEVTQPVNLSGFEERIGEITALLTADGEHKRSLKEQQADSIRYLNELNSWLESFANSGTAQLQSVLHNLQKVTREICVTTEVDTSDGDTDITSDSPVTIRALLETLARKVCEIDSTVGKLETAVVELASILNTKISPNDDDRDAAITKVVGMIDRQREEQEHMLRSIAEELSNDIRGERLRFVEAMKEATAINVQIHVEEFKKELSREVLTMTQEVGRLQKERQALEQQITELFAFFAKQRAEVEQINIERQRQLQDQQSQRSSRGSRNRPLPCPSRPGSATSGGSQYSG